MPRAMTMSSPADRPEPILRAGAAVLVPVTRMVTRSDHHGAENLPPSGGLLVVANHVSNFDPIVLGTFLVANGRWPHWMAKKELFEVRGLGWLLRHADQIPVDRSAPGGVLESARAALEKGMTVVIYPEGTITGDPLHWPMVGRTGAARLAIQTGVPVVPVGQWGPQEVMGYKKMTRPKLLPRRTMHLYAGPRVDLADLGDCTHDQRAVRRATERIMEAIDAQVELARGETAPDTRYDIRTGERVPKSSLR